MMTIRKRPRGAAREALIAAAREEFDEVGFDETDSNRIARRAGYAPQTFYWHFRDKAEIFTAVFEAFVVEEYQAMRETIPRGPRALVSALLDNHRRHRIFRRSLRHLSIVDPGVRAVRTALRRRQVEALCRGLAGLDPPRAVALMLIVDRLLDAEAEGEMGELGVTDVAALVMQVWQRISGDPTLAPSPIELILDAEAAAPPAPAAARAGAPPGGKARGRTRREQGGHNSG